MKAQTNEDILLLHSVNQFNLQTMPHPLARPREEATNNDGGRSTQHN
jgi:hypothetical protein